MINDFLHDPYDLLGKNPSRKCRKSQVVPPKSASTEKENVTQNDDFYILRDDSL